MSSPRFDTSLAGYKSGSLDKQNHIYRKQQRPQPYPLVQNDSGYESATDFGFDSVLASSSTSLLGLANSIECRKLLQKDSNFASETIVDCYESDDHSISMY